ncbi:MAG TPA: AMP-binding protein [Steroidobacteraceae bacterium]|nr:AMP-binding protein [Steroidobacteraceae bacterium]
MTDTSEVRLLHHEFERSARRVPDKIALRCEDRGYTYAELDAASAALAVALRAGGVAEGDRVAQFIDNEYEAVIGLLGALRAGAVFMPINPSTKPAKLAYLLDDSGARALLTHSALLRVVTEALPQLPGSWPHVYVAGPDASEHASLTAVLAQGAKTSGGRAPVLAREAGDLAALIYTSGSTGQAKGVMLTHANMLAAADSIGTYLGLEERDVILCGLPLAFDYGLYQLLLAFRVGATVVLERTLAFPARVFELARREGVTVLPGVPTFFAMLLNLRGAGTAPDLPGLRLLTNTAAALPLAHIEALRRWFPKARLFSMYGLTECKRVTYLPPEQLDVRPASVGRGMPNVEVWLVDDAGNRLPPGSTGELVIRGPNVMQGYWRKPAETAERLRADPATGETVLYSGDIFRTDADGYLYFLARRDDIIKSRGEKVSPREVEDVLHRLPGVREAAVVGVADTLLGQAIKAYVVLTPGAAYAARDVIKHCLGSLESFMVPKYVEFVDALPQTDTGKVTRAGLRA